MVVVLYSLRGRVVVLLSSHLANARVTYEALWRFFCLLSCVDFYSVVFEGVDVSKITVDGTKFSSLFFFKEAAGGMF